MRGSVGEANRAQLYFGNHADRSRQGVPVSPLRTSLSPNRRKRHRHHDGGTLCRRVLPSLPSARVMRPTPQHSGDHGIRRKSRCTRPRQRANRPAYRRRLCFDHRKRRATLNGLHRRQIHAIILSRTLSSSADSLHRSIFGIFIPAPGRSSRGRFRAPASAYRSRRQVCRRECARCGGNEG